MPNKYQISRWYLATLLAANLSLLLANASPLRVAGVLLLTGLLPGLSWANRLLPSSTSLLRWTTAAALSYSLTTLAGLLLHYLPGPVQSWQLLIVLNLMALLPLLTNGPMGQTKISVTVQGGPNQPSRKLKSSVYTENRADKVILGAEYPCLELPGRWSERLQLSLAGPLPRFLALLLFLLIALLLRTVNLHYSEFQGDEALVMIAAAEALEGHEDALFLRSKGPGELLMPMALWRLAGAINEIIARLPFAIAALLAMATIYLIGAGIGGPLSAWPALLFFACNGFMVAFGRIVQYQVLVVWMSAMAFLMALQWRQTGQQRFAILSALGLGTGLLAHYDAILVLPAIAWLFLSRLIDQWRLKKEAHQKQTATGTPLPAPKQTSQQTSDGQGWPATLKSASLFLATFLLTVLPFYLPFILDPQANRTGDYVGGRIGNELRNNLPDFFHFNAFYSSTYYIILTGLLVLGLLAWFLGRASWSRWWFSALIVAGVLAVTFNANLLAGDKLNLSALPFSLLLLGAFFSFSLTGDKPAAYKQALFVWLAVPFLGYNFVVALGLTHIYTIVPAWSLLAGLGWYYFFDAPKRALPLRRPAWISNGLLCGWVILSTIFLWNAFIRHDVEYWQDYPAGNLSLYWTPYDHPPQAGFFGFAHKSGWKATGQKIATGELRGDYSSNEEPDVTTWYTRGAPRACDPHPEFYFLAADLVDPVQVPTDIIEAGYKKIGAVTLPNQKQMRLMQQTPATLDMGQLDEAALARDFDRTATPAAFARSVRGLLPAEANFGNLIRLIGYDLDTRRAYPGGRVPVTLYWQALDQIPTGYQIFTHLEGESGPIAQSDGVPVCWTYPTDAWRPGQIIADQHAIQLSPDTPPGHYPLKIGLYLPDSLERLDVLDEAGNPAGTSLTLEIVEIGNW